MPFSIYVHVPRVLIILSHHSTVTILDSFNDAYVCVSVFLSRFPTAEVSVIFATLFLLFELYVSL